MTRPIKIRLVKDASLTIDNLDSSGRAMTAVENKPVADCVAPEGVNASFVVRRRDRSGTILLVEDDPGMRELMRDILRRAGYQVLTAESEAQALAVWEQFNPKIHLLLTDVMIPHRTTGLELARKLKGSKPKLKVIYTSGFGREICGGDPELTASPFLKKPFTPAELVDVVARSLEPKPGLVGTPS